MAPTGTKAWAVMYTVPGTEKRARMTLGSYPATPLAKARALAIEAHAKVEAGTDPHAEVTPGTMTVAVLIDSYVAKHARTIKTGKDLARASPL